MSDKVLEIIAGVAKKSVEEIKDSINEQKLWDSLLHVEMVIAIESEFDIFFSPEEIAQIDTPAKVLDVVNIKVAAREA